MRHSASEYLFSELERTIPTSSPLTTSCCAVAPPSTMPRTSLTLIYQMLILTLRPHPLLEVRGSIYPLTVDFAPTLVSLRAMNFKGVGIQGPLVALRNSLHSLMKFAAEKIVLTTMAFPLIEGGVDAMETLQNGKMRTGRRCRYAANSEPPKDVDPQRAQNWTVNQFPAAYFLDHQVFRHCRSGGSGGVDADIGGRNRVFSSTNVCLAETPACLTESSWCFQYHCPSIDDLGYIV
ncbi:hypothetical protein ASPWEDRAFT_169480 [Aspergillus wentii DTO 134E9]|uniref:Uncharacterized protein n=1 Tax=Aspergillus wentii DTO 134E9 TaxID=1073089 RepID=A0A1L9RXT7_ASPWE|nr:uncharacterized protein ASPWEDRAFT_169480 [Aspergillus wentii DTO 134E9]OJJ39648.1 hypothetical protein ASPWEDRAFT_169480 [Aspergillus wentii DTO 134E9]